MFADLERLCSLTDIEWGGEGSDWNCFFDPIGLILRLPPTHGGYWCSPANSVSFATTGGDGTHFSLLRTGERLDDHCPVVMTVPMSENPNIIVGENLREFLALGCRRGYFALDQLVYAPAEGIREYSRDAYDAEASDEEMESLRLIESTFRLAPWPDVRRRLAELRLQYFSAVEVAPREGAG
jgi:hypothetical protein